MSHKSLALRYILGSVLGGLLLAGVGCGDDKQTNPGAEASFTVTLANVGSAYDYLVSGVFNTPVGASGPGPAANGSAYEFTVAGTPGSALSFTTMYGQSNDLFFAPDGAGIPLFTAQGKPFSGDVTGWLHLWDAGVEANEQPGVGPNQAPRQPAPNTGPADPNTAVRMVNDGYSYPPVAEALKVTVAHLGGYEFNVRIRNMNPLSPISPGVYVVHTAPNPLFTPGQAEPGMGLEAQAEDGNPGPLGMNLAERTGLTTPFAPGVFAVHSTGTPLFRVGSADDGHGLEALAEDANPGPLAAYLAGARGVKDSGVFNTPTGAQGPGPIFPGQSFRFSFKARRGDRLSFASMLGQSNDVFVGPGQSGLALFDGDGPVTGDITGMLSLWDAGTEANEYPGAGPHQAPRQAGPDMGDKDSNPRVRRAGGDYVYPGVSDLVEVTITSP